MTTVQPIEPGDVDERVTDRVLTAIAEEADTDPVELDRPLFEVIDPDSLNALFQRHGNDVTVEFTYLEYRVQVVGDGDVTVTGTNR